MINNKNVIDAINKNAKETLRKRIDAEVNHILQKG